MSDPVPRKGMKPLQEYAVLALLILIGTPIAAWWGLRDGKDLATKAYGEAAETAESEAVPEEAAEEATASTPESIERGAILYQANCVACHGEKADGKGPAALAFTPPPRDFTDPSAKWTQGRSPGEIFATVANGVPGTGMAGFAGALSETERWDLVHYIVSLPGAAGGNP